MPRWSSQIQSLALTDPSCELLANVAMSGILFAPHFNLWDTLFDSLANNLYKVERSTKRRIWLNCQKTLDERGNLHSETSAALVSNDVKLYFLHGCHIEDEKLFLTPPENIDASEILKVQNVDARRELIRRKGIEQLLDSLFHRVIETQQNYSLIEVLLSGTSGPAKFLKMLNPSIGVWHMEGVPNYVQTIEDALQWRNNNWFAHAETIT